MEPLTTGLFDANVHVGSTSLSVGQRVRISEGAEKYGGLCGVIIHREWITEQNEHRREHPEARRAEGRLAVIVELESPPAGFEPVILCYEEQVVPAPG